MERGIFRRRLMSLYRKDIRYQNTVLLDLRPLWSDVPRDADFAVPAFQPSSVTHRARRAGDGNIELPRSPELALYESAVIKTVAKLMGLTLSGQPARWVVQAVHADVASQHFPPKPLSPPDLLLQVPVVPDEDVAVQLTVSPTFVSARLVVGDRPACFPFEGDDDDCIDTLEVDLSDYVTSGFGKDEWDRLERVAIDLLREGLTAIHARFDDRYPQRYVSRTERQEEDLRALVRYFFYNRPPEDRAAGERFRRLAKVIGIDYPKTPARSVGEDNNRA